MKLRFSWRAHIFLLSQHCLWSNGFCRFLKWYKDLKNLFAMDKSGIHVSSMSNYPSLEPSFWNFFLKNSLPVSFQAKLYTMYALKLIMWPLCSVLRWLHITFNTQHHEQSELFLEMHMHICTDECTSAEVNNLMSLLGSKHHLWWLTPYKWYIVVVL